MIPQLQHLITRARPGTRIRIIEIEVPGESDPQAPFSTAEGTGEDENITGVHSSGSGGSYSANEHRLRQLLQMVHEPMKLAEWSRLIGQVWTHAISERELDRAISARALVAQVKGEGKDHKAVVIEPEAMARYLTLCHAVQQGLEPTPGWWADVRKGSNARISK